MITMAASSEDVARHKSKPLFLYLAKGFGPQQNRLVSLNKTKNFYFQVSLDFVSTQHYKMRGKRNSAEQFANNCNLKHA